MYIFSSHYYRSKAIHRAKPVSSCRVIRPGAPWCSAATAATHNKCDNIITIRVGSIIVVKPYNNNKSTRRAQNSPGLIRSGSDPDPNSGDQESGSGWLPEFTGDFLVQKYTSEIFVNTGQFFSPKKRELQCGKVPCILQCWRIFRKICRYGYSCGWFPEYNHFFLV